MITHYYNTPYLQKGGGEQREFGLITTKVVRPLKAGIGKTRRKLADKLYESGNRKTEEAMIKFRQVLNEGAGVKNKTLRNQVLRNEAPKAKTTVSYNAPQFAAQGGGGATWYKSMAKENSREILDNPFFGKGEKKLVKKILKKESGIAMDKNVGEEILAHELGHAKGKVSGGVRGLISKSDPRTAQGYEGSVSIYRKAPRPTKDTGFLRSVKDHLSEVKNSGLIVAEENAATREGLKILKRNGATKEELRRAKKNLTAAGDTYRAVRKKAVRSSLGRVVDIPSRRNTKNIVL